MDFSALRSFLVLAILFGVFFFILILVGKCGIYILEGLERLHLTAVSPDFLRFVIGVGSAALAVGAIAIVILIGWKIITGEEE